MSEVKLAALRRAALKDEGALEAWNRLCWFAGQLLRAPIALVLVDGDGAPVVAATAGLVEPRVAPDESLADESALRDILTTGQSIVVEDVARHGNERQSIAVRRLGGSACISVPLRTSEGHPLGSLCVIDRRGRRWTVGDAALLTELGEHAATEVALRLRISELEREVAVSPGSGNVPFLAADDAIVGHDELTGLPNRLLLYDRLRQVLALARRYGEVLAVLHLDIEGFKGINERYGMQTGDLVLQQVAASLIAGIRESDTVARLSSDDFMIVLPRVGSMENAVAVTRKILNVVERPSQVNGQTIPINAFIGIALYPDDGHDAASLIHLAEVALNRARALGGKVFAFDHGDATSAVP